MTNIKSLIAFKASAHLSVCTSSNRIASVQECDATEVQLLYFRPAQKIKTHYQQQACCTFLYYPIF